MKKDSQVDSQTRFGKKINSLVNDLMNSVERPETHIDLNWTETTLVEQVNKLKRVIALEKNPHKNNEYILEIELATVNGLLKRHTEELMIGLKAQINNENNKEHSNLQILRNMFRVYFGLEKDPKLRIEKTIRLLDENVTVQSSKKSFALTASSAFNAIVLQVKKNWSLETKFLLIDEIDKLDSSQGQVQQKKVQEQLYEQLKKQLYEQFSDLEKHEPKSDEMNETTKKEPTQKSASM